MNVLKLLVMSVVMMLSAGLLANSPLYVLTLVDVRSGAKDDASKSLNVKWSETADRSVLKKLELVCYGTTEKKVEDLRKIWGARPEEICLVPGMDKSAYTLNLNINLGGRKGDTMVSRKFTKEELDFAGGKVIFYFRDGKFVIGVLGREQEVYEDARRAYSTETLYGDRCRLVFEVSEFDASAYAGKLNENDNSGFFWMLNVAGNAGDVGAMRVLRDWNRAHEKDSEVKRWEDMLRHAGGH